MPFGSGGSFDTLGLTSSRDPTRGDSDPERRWTLTNMSEATPDVLSPMCWSLWTPLCELAIRRAWYDFGILPRRMVSEPMDPTRLTVATFFGRQALNVDRMATLMGAVPGTSREEVERTFTGTSRSSNLTDESPRRRSPHITIKAPIVIATQRRRVTTLYADQLSWWQRDVLGEAVEDGRRLLAVARDRFAHAMYLHARSRLIGQGLMGAVVKLAESADCEPLVTDIYAAFGEVSEMSIADDLWSLSRGRLDWPTFMHRHGFHGSNEGNVTGVPWRVRPEPLRAMVSALAQRPEGENPQLRSQGALQRRRVAEEQLRAALAFPQRRLLTLLLRASATQIRSLERGKAAFIMAVDGVRRAARLLGDQLAADHSLADPSDAVFLTIDELLGKFPANAMELTAFRRARRDEYRQMRLPTMFVGMPLPLEAAQRDTTLNTLAGAPGSGGVVQGTARVITDLDRAGEIEEGEILVCRYTDPAWTAAMALAAGIVVDIGAPTSHGAIVARELGIPCVIGTGDGTKQIWSGDVIRVDGTSGTVVITARAQ